MCRLVQHCMHVQQAPGEHLGTKNDLWLVHRALTGCKSVASECATAAAVQRAAAPVPWLPVHVSPAAPVSQPAHGNASGIAQSMSPPRCGMQLATRTLVPRRGKAQKQQASQRPRPTRQQQSIEPQSEPSTLALPADALADLAEALVHHQADCALPQSMAVWAQTGNKWCAGIMQKAYAPHASKHGKCTVSAVAASKSKLTLPRSQLRPRACPVAADVPAVCSSAELHRPLLHSQPGLCALAHEDGSLVPSLAASLFAPDDLGALPNGSEVWVHLPSYALQRLQQQQAQLALAASLPEADAAGMDAGSDNQHGDAPVTRDTPNTNFEEPDAAPPAAGPTAEADAAQQEVSPFLSQPSLAQGATAARVQPGDQGTALDLTQAGCQSGVHLDGSLTMQPPTLVALQGPASLVAAEPEATAGQHDAAGALSPSAAPRAVPASVQGMDKDPADAATVFVLALHTTDSGDPGRRSARQRAAAQGKVGLAAMLADDRLGQLVPDMVWVRAMVTTPASKADPEPEVRLVDIADHSAEVYRVPRKLVRPVPQSHRKAMQQGVGTGTAPATGRPGAFQRLRAFFARSRSPSPANAGTNANTAAGDSMPLACADSQRSPEIQSDNAQAQPVAPDSVPVAADDNDIAPLWGASTAAATAEHVHHAEGTAQREAGLQEVNTKVNSMPGANIDAVSCGEQFASASGKSQPVAEATESPSSEHNAPAPCPAACAEAHVAQAGLSGAKAGSEPGLPEFWLRVYAHNGWKELAASEPVLLQARRASAQDGNVMLSLARSLQVQGVPQDVCCVIVLELLVQPARPSSPATRAHKDLACIGWTAVAPFRVLSGSSVVVDSSAQPLPLQFSASPGGGQTIDVCSMLLNATAHLPCAGEHSLSCSQLRQACGALCRAARNIHLAGRAGTGWLSGNAEAATETVSVQVLHLPCPMHHFCAMLCSVC